MDVMLPSAHAATIALVRINWLPAKRTCRRSPWFPWGIHDRTLLSVLHQRLPNQQTVSAMAMPQGLVCDLLL